jgi:hypothetical protein
MSYARRSTGAGTAAAQQRGPAGLAAAVTARIPRAGERQVTTLEDHPGREPDNAGDGIGTALVSPSACWRATLGPPPSLIRSHRVFAVVLAAAVPRVFFPPAERPGHG